MAGSGKYAASVGRPGVIVPGMIVLGVLLIWTVQYITAIYASHGRSVQAVWIFAFVIVLTEMGLCFTERRFKTTARQQRGLDSAYLVAIIPAYNEDPPALRECIA